MSKNNKRFTLDVAQQEFISRNLIPLFNEYKNARELLLAQTQEGYKVLIRLDDLKKGKNPRVFSKTNLYTIQNIILWCKLNYKSFELLSDEYKGNNKLLKWKCSKEGCNEEFDMSWDNILHNHGCSYCCGMQVGLSNCLVSLNPQLASEWHPTKNNNLTPYDITCGNGRKQIWWKCKECGYEWSANVKNRNKGTGCPKCVESKGEKQLDSILTQYNIPHDSQYTFDDLRGVGNGLLKFDTPIFWDVEKTELRMLVEYDGIFHYEKQYDNDNFEILKKHDKLKNEYCDKHNIKLLRIPYWEFDNNDLTKMS